MMFFLCDALTQLDLGWWGFTFPLGVFAVSTTTIAEELPSLFFKVLGTVSLTPIPPSSQFSIGRLIDSCVNV
jgi:hypothetical protein